MRKKKIENRNLRKEILSQMSQTSDLDQKVNNIEVIFIINY